MTWGLFLLFFPAGHPFGDQQRHSNHSPVGPAASRQALKQIQGYKPGLHGDMSMGRGRCVPYSSEHLRVCGKMWKDVARQIRNYAQLWFSWWFSSKHVGPAMTSCLTGHHGVPGDGITLKGTLQGSLQQPLSASARMLHCCLNCDPNKPRKSL